jgi:pimeloyl-ACP methyl ester carboxylesterase
MATYVLVAGAWLGGWAWRPVARQLRTQGHEVHPVTLTGMGDRLHLGAPETDLDTYITDVVNVIEFEDLEDVVLVGHSYAGGVVTGVADRIPERIALLAYLDAGPSPDGVAFLDLQPPPARELFERLVAEDGDGWRIPMPSWEDLEEVMGASLDGLGPEERARMRAHATPQPLRTATQALTLRKPADEKLPKLLISCSIPLDLVRKLIAESHPWFTALGGPEWSFLELPTGHWPMFSVPDRLASLLGGLEVAGGGDAEAVAGR